MERLARGLLVLLAFSAVSSVQAMHEPLCNGAPSSLELWQYAAGREGMQSGWEALSEGGSNGGWGH